jgi:localization factor PodJL
MWFQRAADRGDDEARQALAALPGTGPAPETAIAEARPSTNVRQTQIVLARLGYYDGPADGYSSPAYRSALAAYQRDLTRGARAPAGER